MLNKFSEAEITISATEKRDLRCHMRFDKTRRKATLNVVAKQDTCGNSSDGDSSGRHLFFCEDKGRKRRYLSMRQNMS
jgi:hypothetical protein